MKIRNLLPFRDKSGKTLFWLPIAQSRIDALQTTFHDGALHPTHEMPFNDDETLRYWDFKLNPSDPDQTHMKL